MKVISKCRYEEESKFPIILECKDCGSLLEIEEGDIIHGYLGAEQFLCPVCRKVQELVDYNIEEFKCDNIVFPDSFYDYNNGADISSDKVKEYIKQGINFLRKNTDGNFHFIHFNRSGNTFVIVIDRPKSGNYIVLVSKGYYEAKIPYTNEDYQWRNL